MWAHYSLKQTEEIHNVLRVEFVPVSIQGVCSKTESHIQMNSIMLQVTSSATSSKILKTIFLNQVWFGWHVATCPRATLPWHQARKWTSIPGEYSQRSEMSNWKMILLSPILIVSLCLHLFYYKHWIKHVELFPVLNLGWKKGSKYSQKPIYKLTSWRSSCCSKGMQAMRMQMIS